MDERLDHPRHRVATFEERMNPIAGRWPTRRAQRAIQTQIQSLSPRMARRAYPCVLSAKRYNAEKVMASCATRRAMRDASARRLCLSLRLRDRGLICTKALNGRTGLILFQFLFLLRRVVSLPAGVLDFRCYLFWRSKTKQEENKKKKK